MTRPARRRTWWIVALLVLVAVVLFTPCGGYIWDGRFRPAEHRLKFEDEAGRPVPGVTLQVLTKAGGICYLYPVNEFVPDQTPTSDANGEMVFHHVAIYLEFGGHENRNLVGMDFGDQAPQYECVFLRDGREVHRVWYDELRPRGDYDRQQFVTRRWEYPDWSVREFKERGNSSSHIRRLFDANGDGRFDREEATAANYFDVRLNDCLERGPEEISFALVERTIVVRKR